MSFAYDVCRYLLEKHAFWDSLAVEDGFNLDLDSLNVPDAERVSAEIIYLNQIPNDRTDAVCVYDTGGYESFRLHGGCKALENPTAQVRVRNSSLKVAEETARKIYELLDDSCNLMMNGVRYLQVNAVSPPAYIGADQVTTVGMAVEYAMNLYAKKD